MIRRKREAVRKPGGARSGSTTVLRSDRTRASSLFRDASSSSFLGLPGRCKQRQLGGNSSAARMRYSSAASRHSSQWSKCEFKLGSFERREGARIGQGSELPESLV